ncbi:hypothetical protein JGU66_18140 [Myxococcaceae bacterium JPH2]|nr:hypothetical protein [Myxococcaceae bacterium JPH2]
MRRNLPWIALMFSLAACGGSEEPASVSKGTPETQAEALCTSDPWACACATHTTRDECRADKSCYWTGPTAAGSVSAMSNSYCKPTYEVQAAQ